MSLDIQLKPAAAPVTYHSVLPSPTPPSGPSQPTVADVLRIFWRRLWVVVLILGAALATAVYVTRHTPPTWQARAEMILVEHSNVSVITTPDSMPASSSSTQESVETQMTMIQGPEMARRALLRMASNQRAKNPRSKKLPPRRPGAKNGRSSVPPPPTATTVSQLSNSIQVFNPRDTNLIDLAVRAKSPTQARLLANAICQSFMAWKKEIAQHNSKEALTILEARANRARAALNIAEQKELNYRLTHRLVDVGAQSTALLNQSLAADAQVATLQQQLIADQTHLRNLGGRLKNVDQAIRSGTGVRDDNLVVSLQSKLNDLETQRAQQALKVTPKFPGILPELDAQIADIKSRLAKAVQGTLDNKRPSLQAQDTLFQAYEQAQTDVLLSQSKLSAAKKLQGQLKGQTAQFPTRGLDDGRLQRTADLNRQLYTSLQAALNAARLQKDNATSNVQLVQSATADPAPVDPNPLRNLAVGAAVGIVLSLAAVMLLEQADRRVRNVDDLRALVSGPIIGALPQMSRARIRAVGEGRPALSDAEAFNLASANLGLTLRWATPAGGWENRVVLVTSALPGEGKSVTAAGIARSLALTGRKVVLINADLRRPTLDKMFPSKDNIGLGDVLEGRVWPTDALRPSEYDNLQILHSGNVRSNPASLFSRPQMAGLLQGLRRTYDVILIDTPACAVVADALLLAPHADCVLHVVGAGQVDQDAVRSATASLSAAAPNTIAYVLNRAPRSRQDNIYYAQPRHRAPTPTTPDVPDALTRTMELRLADLAHAVQDKQDKIGEPPRADETKNTGETHE